MFCRQYFPSETHKGIIGTSYLTTSMLGYTSDPTSFGSSWTGKPRQLHVDMFGSKQQPSMLFIVYRPLRKGGSVVVGCCPSADRFFHPEKYIPAMMYIPLSVLVQRNICRPCPHKRRRAPERIHLCLLELERTGKEDDTRIFCIHCFLRRFSRSRARDRSRSGGGRNHNMFERCRGICEARSGWVRPLRTERNSRGLAGDAVSVVDDHMKTRE